MIKKATHSFVGSPENEQGKNRMSAAESHQKRNQKNFLNPKIQKPKKTSKILKLSGSPQNPYTYRVPLQTSQMSPDPKNNDTFIILFGIAVLSCCF